jgi:hypothetical protein
MIAQLTCRQLKGTLRDSEARGAASNEVAAAMESAGYRESVALWSTAATQRKSASDFANRPSMGSEILTQDFKSYTREYTGRNQRAPSNLPLWLQEPAVESLFKPEVTGNTERAGKPFWLQGAASVVSSGYVNVSSMRETKAAVTRSEADAPLREFVEASGGGRSRLPRHRLDGGEPRGSEQPSEARGVGSGSGSGDALAEVLQWLDDTRRETHVAAGSGWAEESFGRAWPPAAEVQPLREADASGAQVLRKRVEELQRNLDEQRNLKADFDARRSSNERLRREVVYSICFRLYMQRGFL